MNNIEVARITEGLLEAQRMAEEEGAALAPFEVVELVLAAAARHNVCHADTYEPGEPCRCHDVLQGWGPTK